MTKTKAKKPRASKAKAKDNGIKLTAVVTMLLDESGSMAGLRDATIAGFNEYTSQLKKELKGTDCYFSAIKFDSRGVTKLQVGAQIEQAIELSAMNYCPCAGTPLLDAIGKTIQATDEIVREKGANRVTLVVQTDGQENESREFTKAKIKVMVEERTAKGWVFLFMGAGIDAFAEASQFGFAAQNTVSYVADAESTRQMYQTVSAKTASYSATADMAAAVRSASFNAGDRAALGEAEVLSKLKKTVVKETITTDYSLKGD